MRGWWIFSLAISAPAAADVYTVGSGAQCTHANVQDAITAGLQNGNGLDVINVARNRTYSAQALVVQNDTVVIQGGYADCSSTSADPANPTVLSGAGGSAAAVVRVQGNGNVTLRNLVLRDGDSGSDGGGLAVVDGPHLITLHNVQLQNNRAARGAGLAVSAATGTSVSVSLQLDSGIYSNIASSDGGGIYCRNATLSLVADRGIINSNSARDGGGIYADQCTLDLASGHPFGVLWNNQATRNGGGVYAFGAAAITRLYSFAASTPTRVQANRAEGRGGALYSRDGADLQIQNVEFLANSASDVGAILIHGSGSTSGNDLSLASSGLIAGASACPSGQICNRFVDNRSQVAGVTNSGVAAIALQLDGNSAGRALLRGVLFDANQGGSVVHSNIATPASGRLLDLANAAFVGNQVIGTQSALVVGHALVLSFISIAGNSVAGPSVLWGQDSISVLQYLAAWQPGKPLLLQTGGSVSSAFLIANDLSGIPFVSSNLTADPGFVSASDLHLRRDALALDYASSTSVLVPDLAVDIEQRPRPVDDPLVANAYGAIDVGAFEASADGLLQSGFEH